MHETTKTGVIFILIVLVGCLIIDGVFFHPAAVPQTMVKPENTSVVNVSGEDSIVPAQVVLPTVQPEIMLSDLVPLFALSGSLTDSEIRNGLSIYNSSIYRAQEKENITEASLVAYVPQKKDRVAIGNGFFDQVIYLGDDEKVHIATNVTVREGTSTPPCYKLMLEDKASKATSDKLYFYLFGDKGRTAIGITRTKLSPPPISGSGSIGISPYDSNSEVGVSNGNAAESSTGDPGNSGNSEGPVGDELAA